MHLREMMSHLMMMQMVSTPNMLNISKFLIEDDDGESGDEPDKDVLGNVIDDEDEILSDDAGSIGGLDDLPIFNRERMEEKQMDEQTIGKGVISQVPIACRLITSVLERTVNLNLFY